MPIWYLRDEIRSALNTKNNLNGSIIQRMSNMGFTFDGNHNIANEWDIPGCDPDLLNVIFDLQTSLSAIDFQKTLRSLWSGKQGIYWLFQCTNSDSSDFLKWSLIMNNIHNTAKGRSALWFTNMLQHFDLQTCGYYDTWNPMYQSTIQQRPSTDRRRKEWFD